MTINGPKANAFGEEVDLLVQRLSAIENDRQVDARSNPEDQLKFPISSFLENASLAFNRKVSVFTEHRQLAGDAVEGVRLDMAVKGAKGQLLGHIELKAPGKSANPYRGAGWTKHDRQQWSKLSNHPNLIYSNGWEWTLLRAGAGSPLIHIILDPGADGTVSDEQKAKLEELLRQFLSWQPIVPSTPKALADVLAPLTAFLRDNVIEVVDSNPDSASGLSGLYKKWRTDLIPGATTKDFADSFAQTFTYALLLARIESKRAAEDFRVEAVTETLLKNGHKLIGSVLELMSQGAYRKDVDGPVGLLEATIGAVDTKKLSGKTDPWLYFYEDFLATYDPKMRNDAGVYYTPVEIVRFQVRLLDDILRTRFGRERGLGANDIHLLDPAAGTGAYPLAVSEFVLQNSKTPADDAQSLARRMFAFELLVGPYSVAHLRLTQMLEQTGVELGEKCVQVFLTNTLSDAGDVSGANQQISLWEIEQNLNEETRRAGLVKRNDTHIRVILGNPPYDRGSKQKTLGTGSAKFPNVILEEVNGNAPLLDDFVNPLKEIGAGGQAKNLYNSYVYFFRWAIWKACEQHRDEAGVVSFITSSSYLRGPGFAGMRKYMRQMFDEIWIVDLGGEGRGARKEENVFAIQTPVAIFFGIQWEKTKTGSPKKHRDRVKSKAKVHYLRVSGTRGEKLAALAAFGTPESDSHWEVLPSSDWFGKFVPDSATTIASFAPLNWVFPWYFSGSKAGRKWVIAPTHEALQIRLSMLANPKDPAEAEAFFDNSPSGRKYSVPSASDLIPGSTSEVAICDDAELANLPTKRYGYRSFDRQFCIADHRMVDRAGRAWTIESADQLYFATLTSTSLSSGPALTVSPYVPDLHFFRNRGAKDIHPLYRTDDKSEPNVSTVLLNALESSFGYPVSAKDVALYAFGLLGTGAYTAKFADDLAESAARVPFTTNPQLFDEVKEFGKKLVFEQTWGERCGELNEFGQATGTRFEGAAYVETATSSSSYPEDWWYDEEQHTLHIGTSGVISGVSPEVMDFNVSGMKVVNSWLGYRMKTPAGKSSSPLDQIQASRWEFDRELVELLWQVEFFVNAEETGAALLNRVVKGDLIPIEELGPPAEHETKAPKRKPKGQVTVV